MICPCAQTSNERLSLTFANATSSWPRLVVDTQSDGYACKPRHALRLGLRRMDEYIDAVLCDLVAEFERRSGALFGARLTMTADPLSGLSARTDQFVLSATQY